jgi:large subunit ribosomal protein L31
LHPARQGSILAGNLLTRETTMKPGIHPDYHPVVFRDRSANFTFLTKSTLTSSHTIEWEDGNTYPVIDVDVSSASHPFYTGKSRVLDTAGRVEQFNRRYGNRQPQQKKS